MFMPPAIDPLWFRILAGLLIGLALGSFTTMLSYRTPRKISVIYPPSHCPKCHTPLKFRDLFPVLSWFIQHGRCRHCGASISGRYVIIELVTAIAVTCAFALIGFRPRLIFAVLGIVTFITLVTINLERDKDV
jgi:prepilin signal peptidase PulO-like enzyme (type II secretory pathway)